MPCGFLGNVLRNNDFGAALGTFQLSDCNLLSEPSRLLWAEAGGQLAWATCSLEPVPGVPQEGVGTNLLAAAFATSMRFISLSFDICTSKILRAFGFVGDSLFPKNTNHSFCSFHMFDCFSTDRASNHLTSPLGLGCGNYWNDGSWRESSPQLAASCYYSLMSRN